MYLCVDVSLCLSVYVYMYCEFVILGRPSCEYISLRECVSEYVCVTVNINFYIYVRAFCVCSVYVCACACVCAYVGMCVTSCVYSLLFGCRGIGEPNPYKV